MAFRICRAALVLAAAIAVLPAEAEERLSIATWGGAYGQSQAIAYFKPFTQATGIAIDVTPYDGTLAAIKSKIAVRRSPIDVVDLSAGALGTLCHDGLLDRIDKGSLGPGPDGENAADDFLAGGLETCGVASVAWSTVAVFDRQAFKKGAPTKIADLLDTESFPGKRALPNGPSYTLELALLADGVEPQNVYGELGTQAGLARAFQALDRIKPDIVWWDEAQDPIRWLLNRKAAMAVSYSNRIFRTAVTDKRIALLWDGQIYDLDLWAIPKSAANKTLARQFIVFATEPKRLATQAELIAYGPMRKSAVALVGKHPVVDVDMQPYLPTAPDNFKTALQFDEAWWAKHGEAITKQFTAWRKRAATAESADKEKPKSEAKPQDEEKPEGEATPESQSQ